MQGIVTIVLIIIAFGSLVLISTPPKPGQRLKFKRQEGITIPPSCVLTGNPATEAHPVQGFTGTPLYIGKAQMQLPFSQEGWKQYSKVYPRSLRFFKNGLNTLVPVPLFGGLLIIFMWIPFAGLSAGLLAFAELFYEKRQLVVPLSISVKGDRVTAIDVLGVSERFIETFLAANGQLTLTDYRVLLGRQVRIQFLLALILLVAVAGMITFGVASGSGR